MGWNRKKGKYISGKVALGESEKQHASLAN